MEKEWFAEWFDSPYYHLLYKKHDENEAKAALDNLLQALAIEAGKKILDLACGKGRHARYLAENGFVVTGIDISKASIDFARAHEHPGLEFYQHDMRKPFRINYYDAVMNMFTSFGYFKTDLEHLLSLKHVATGLKPGGLFLLDFFNASFVRKNLVVTESKTVDGIDFSLSRWIKADYVFKNIAFEAVGRSFHFQEAVRLFELADFQAMFAALGLQIRQTYGDYDLSSFEVESSKRLIIIAEKP
jgi:SAM-dependent methyltransferase